MATFTLGDTVLGGDAFAATIDWGDGSMPSLGVIQDHNGVFTVTGSHLYTRPGQYLLEVNLVSPTDTVLDWGTAHVATPSVDLVSQPLVLSPIYAGGQILLASFSDPNPKLTAADFQALVDWGNGYGPTSATISGSAGTFWVYATPPGGTPGYEDEDPALYGGMDQFLVHLWIDDTAGDNLDSVVMSVTIAAGSATVQTSLKRVWFHVESPSQMPPYPGYPEYEFLYKIEWGDGTRANALQTP